MKGNESMDIDEVDRAKALGKLVDTTLGELAKNPNAALPGSVIRALDGMGEGAMRQALKMVLGSIATLEGELSLFCVVCAILGSPELENPDVLQNEFVLHSMKQHGISVEVEDDDEMRGTTH